MHVNQLENKKTWRKIHKKNSHNSECWLSDEKELGVQPQRQTRVESVT